VPRDVVSLYRTRLAKEEGAVIKDWGGKLSIALVYPNYYRLGMSNLGFQIVYHLLNSRHDVVAERVFLPEGQEMSLYLQSGKALVSLESQTPLQQFELIAFSLSFENDYPNILKILEMGKIPLYSEERLDSFPFVMAGGITTFLNPEPIAPFVDFFLMGEAEAELNEFVNHFLTLNARRSERRELLKSLAGNMTTLYVPAFYEPKYHIDGTLKSFLPREDGIPKKVKVARQPFGKLKVAMSSIQTPDTEFGDKILIELGRGCGRSCRFCAAGYVYRPPRVHSEGDLRVAVDASLAHCDQLGLVSPAVSDVPGIENATALILERGGRFSVSSLRADNLSRMLIDHLKAANQNKVAIAPEAGSERLRRVINKHLTKEQIIRAVKRIERAKDFGIRLYFLIGLPTETREDVAGIIELVKIIKDNMVKVSASRGRIGQIKLSVNCFVPKPFTPFQWCGLEQIYSLKEKQKWLKKALSKAGGIRVTTDRPKWAYIQTLLSLGDRRAASILAMAHKFEGDWPKALRSSDIDPDFFVYRPKGFDEILPWDFIDHGISKRHLKEEYDQALKGEESEVCHVGECHRCGVCVKLKQ
jgi:radical SAM superfamily enzyme YgiQ (UPF0313 family)